ncbi:putative ADP-ribosylation factor GTPase-activating protein AGD13 [Cucumis melo var. makuwa]|uniref:ADP-ribosylation factor GTPase-activating protein AGD13 n=1 Tax=Cucumis melo var. makuwa TaxID=1194695 RepID=A0A5A7UBF4_CUCMM|nr:putative ADP-ribosylation factor GTPase-activating protein AGD13 [Cucumis melo var. makuwa]
MNNRAMELGRPGSGGKRRLKDLLLLKDNRFCADCRAADPKWASANIGVFICLKCCGVHRSLGSHISKVLSVTLDEWNDDEIDAMIEVGGNSSANAIYEAYIPEGYSKPGPDATHEQRSKFIRSKYELQEFLKPSLRILSSNSDKSNIQASFSTKIMNSFRTNSSQKPVSSCYTFQLLQSQEGMVEYIGLLKIKVIRGTNLAIRDMMSSDPYVVMTLGQQTVQTSVVRSNLNPVWNEELTLSVPQGFGSIKLQVYDYDTFSADDIMGEAEIDLQPLITSAMAFGDAGMFSNMQIGKWLKSHDNALISDSTVNIVDGKVKQEIALKLQNVESGELDLELEWLALEQ